MTEKTKPPKGVVTVLTGPDGSVFASVSDFRRDGYGGCSTQEAQTMRARQQLAFAAVRAMCSDHVLKAMEAYDCEQLLRRLEIKVGFKVTILPVGYDESRGA